MDERFRESCPEILRSNTGPERLETLSVRTIAFAALFAAVCDAWARAEHNAGFGELLEGHCSGASRLWQQLTDEDLPCREVRNIDPMAEGLE